MGERPYWNMEIEPILNTAAMEEMQFEKLKMMLIRLKENSPFYGKMMKERKLDPERLSASKPSRKRSNRSTSSCCEI